MTAALSSTLMLASYDAERPKGPRAASVEPDNKKQTENNRQNKTMSDILFSDLSPQAAVG